MENKNLKFGVVGAGISGLSVAYYLKKKFPKATIVIFEKEGKAGGVIQTSKEGFNQGPHIFQSGRAGALMTLIQELGLEERVIYSLKEAKKRFIYKNKALDPLPYSFMSLLRWLPILINAIVHDSLAKRGAEDETVFEFCCRRFGKKIALEVFDPLAIGIWAGDIRQLSVKACFPHLKSLEERYRSVIWGGLSVKKGKRSKKGLFTLQGGMKTLIDSLSKSLKPCLQFNTQLQAIAHQGSGWQLATSQGDFTVDRLFLALPAHQTRRYLKALDPCFDSFFEKLPCGGVHVVSLRFDQRLKLEKGFGYLVPSTENESVLGAIFDSCFFSLEKEALTFMVKYSAKEPYQEALRALKSHLGIQALPSQYLVTSYPDAIPHYQVGHVARLKRFQERLNTHYPSLQVLGNFLEGVSVNDCVTQAQKIASLQGF